MTTTTANPFSSQLPQPKEISLLDNQFVSMKFITKLTTLSDKWFYKLIQEGKFPKPIKFGRKSLWLKIEVEEWLWQRIIESRGGVK